MNNISHRKRKIFTDKELQEIDLKKNPSFEEKVQLEKWHQLKGDYVYDQSQFQRLRNMVDVALTELEKANPNDLTLSNIEEGIFKLVNQTGLSVNRSGISHFNCDNFNKNVVGHQASNRFNKSDDLMSVGSLLNHKIPI